MSKELEAFMDILGILSAVTGCDVDTDSEHIKIVKQALQRLESIDNANPSEALCGLESYINHIIFSKDLISQKQQLLTNIAAIKQALLKAEEEHNSVNLLMQELDCKDFAELRKYARCGYKKLNKKYLKWEDLEFEDFAKEIEVRIGDNICKLEYRVSMLGNKTVILMYNNKIYLQLFENGKQFFNDLHLEVVDNE